MYFEWTVANYSPAKIATNFEEKKLLKKANCVTKRVQRSRINESRANLEDAVVSSSETIWNGFWTVSERFLLSSVFLETSFFQLKVSSVWHKLWIITVAQVESFSLQLDWRLCTLIICEWKTSRSGCCGLGRRLGRDLPPRIAISRWIGGLFEPATLKWFFSGSTAWPGWMSLLEPIRCARLKLYLWFWLWLTTCDSHWDSHWDFQATRRTTTIKVKRFCRNSTKIISGPEWTEWTSSQPKKTNSSKWTGFWFEEPSCWRRMKTSCVCEERQESGRLWIG